MAVIIVVVVVVVVTMMVMVVMVIIPTLEACYKDEIYVLTWNK